MKKILLLITSLFYFNLISAQTFKISAGGTSSTCTGTFTDSDAGTGGNSGNYVANESYTKTFCPSIAGQVITITFTSFDVHGSDQLCIYDGTSSAATGLGCNNNNTTLNGIKVQPTTSNASGCITFVFTSNGSQHGAGWTATIACAAPCQDVIAGMSGTTPAIVGGYIDICQGETVTFNAQGTYPENGTGYTQSDATSTYLWNFGDGTTSTIKNPTHTFPDERGYTVQLTITDVQGCYSINALDQRVRVSTTPSFAGTSIADNTICVGETTTLTGVVTGTEANFAPSTIVSSILDLPDGTGVCYQTSITMTEFAPGQTLGDANKLAIFANLEHSYAGDLDISIKCPSNVTVQLVPYEGLSGYPPNNTGNIDIGGATTSAGAAGPGELYIWDLAATNTWVNAPKVVDGVDGANLPGGTYLPTGTLTNLNSCILNGTWSIIICDNLAGDDGILYEWGIDFDPSLYPSMEYYTPTFSNPNKIWTTAPNVISTSGSTITVQPATGGTFNYVFQGTDNFGCPYDTTLTLTVTGVTITGTPDQSICLGQSVTFNEVLTVNPGTTTETFTNSTSAAIPDNNTTGVTSNISVSGISPTTVSANPIVKVCLNITHAWDEDLDISLRCPGGTTIDLSSDNGGSGDNFTGTCFSTSAATAITAGTAPFSGDYRPEAAFSGLNACNVNGTWSLIVKDDANFISGTLNNWSISFNNTNTYTYSWSPTTNMTGSTTLTPTVTPTTTTTYTLTATDSKGCSNTDQITVTVNPIPTSTFNKTVNTCLVGNSFDFTNTGSMGGSFTHSWNFGGAIVNTSTAESPTGITYTNPGTYTIKHVVSAGPCKDSTTTTVTVYPSPVAAIPTTVNVLCNGNTTGSLTATGGGTYSWNTTPVQTTATASNLPDGTYSVTVTNSDNCTATASAIITEPPVLDATFTKTDVTCFGANDGTVNVTATGGVTPYTYSWNTVPVKITPNVTGLPPGTYTCFINDKNGCTDNIVAIIAGPAALVASATGTPSLCNGANNGTAAASATGGTGSYTYSWSPGGATTASVTGLAPGTHTVIIRDANNCSSTAQYIVTEPTLLTSVVTETNLVCAGTNNGSAIVSVGGGVTPYTYSWGPALAQTTSSVSSLAAGTYTSIVRDNNNCSVTKTFVITTPPALNASVTDIDLQCKGINNGSATASATGGTGAYTYSWHSPVSSSATISNMAPGTYTVTIRDNNFCSDTAIAIIRDAVNDTMTLVTSKTDATCNAANGGGSVAVSGGSPGYTYLWTPDNETIASISGKPVGTYSVTVTDNNGCFKSTFISVVNTGAPTIDAATTTDLVCFGNSNGTASVTVSGGTLPYTYTWFGSSSTTSSASGLVAGTYSVTVTDSALCAVNQTFVISQPTLLSGSISTFVNPSCNGSSDGSIDVMVSGGTPPYTYSWNTGTLTQDITGLPGGTYTLNITDSNLCTTSITQILTPPALLDGNITGTNVLISGQSTGAADLTVSGGTTPYTYSWYSGQSTQDINSIPAGTYSVLVTDAKGCTTLETVIITEPTPIVLAISSIDENCGQSNGSIDLNITGGVTPYTFNWSPSVSTDSFASGLSAGTYSVTVTDANGSVKVISDVVNNIPGAVVNITTVVNASCEGICNGSITTSASGTSSPYTYSWNTSPVKTTANITGLCDSSYTVTMTDANGCTSVSTAAVLNDPSLIANLTATNPTCNGTSTGSINLTVTNGTAPYTYNWSNGTSAEDPINLPSGFYEADFVVDANGCTAYDSITLVDPAILTAGTSKQDVLCNGNATGSATVTPAGGTTPYTYTWSNGASGTTTSGLSAGTYTYTVTDQNACTATSTVIISQPTALVLTITPANANCGQSDGTATSSLSGGTLSYSYLWNIGAQTNPIATGIPTGTYSLTATDGNGCTITAGTIVGNTPGGTLSNTINNHVSCAGGSDGSASVLMTGGSSPFSYTWTSGGTNTLEAGLEAGSYTVTATDAKGCTATTAFIINEPPVLTGPIIVQNNTCNGDSIGSINLIPGGGSPPYSYIWSNGQNTQDIDSLIAGTYTGTLTDSKLCSLVVSSPITEPLPILLNFTTVPANCGQADGSATVQITNGVAPFFIEWFDDLNDTTHTGLEAGINYSIDVYGNNGCLASSSVIISNLSGPTAVLASTKNVSCFNGSDGEATIMVSGGLPPYNYLWNDSLSQNTINATGLKAGTYNAVATDANGCNSNVEAIITQPPVISITGTVNNVSCFNGNDGSISLSVTGGTGAYTYSWSPGSGTTNSISGLITGSYTAYVTDANLCTKNYQAFISQPTQLTGTVNVTEVSCNGGNDGTATVNVSGGTGSYTYSWIPSGGNSSTASGLAAGTYSCNIRDAKNCLLVLEAIIIEPALLVASNTKTDVTCNGLSNGSATISVTGGNPPYGYNWNQVGSGSFFNALNASGYSVDVVDSRGCLATTSFTINEPLPLTNIFNTTDPSCFGVCDGSIQSIVSGGTGPYTYTWNDPDFQTGATATGLCAGNFNVLIRDAKGCTINPAATLNQPLEITLNLTSTQSTCGNSDGSATVAVASGAGPFTYLWNDGSTQTTSTAVNIPSGNYMVTVTGLNGCNETGNISVSDLGAPTVTIPTSGPALCFNGTNGYANAQVDGGTPPYTYSWSNGDTTATPNNFSAGIYTLEITDSDGCKANDFIEIGEAPELKAIIASSNNPSCAGTCDGNLTLQVTGGTPPYAYQWNTVPGQNTITASNLCDGSYNAIVTDFNNCTVNISATVTEPLPIVLSLTSTTSYCDLALGTAKATYSNAVEPVQYLWGDGQEDSIATNLPPGNISCKVTSAVGCTATANIIVGNVPAGIASISSSTNVSCAGLSDGSATVSMGGGVSPFTYSWNSLPSQNTVTANNLPAGDYIVIVTDNKGCTSSANIKITEPLPVDVTLATVDPLCATSNDGTASVIPRGGTEPYFYFWGTTLPQTDSLAVGLGAGYTTIKVTDANNCSKTDSVLLVAPPALAYTESITPSHCNLADGAASITPSGGVGPYTNTWEGGIDGFAISNVIAGSYDFDLEDANGCILNSSVIINDLKGPSLAIGSIVTPACYGENTGSIEAICTGGVIPYTFLWVDGQVTPIATGLMAGNYCVSVTDASGCINSICYTLMEPDSLSSTSTIIDPTCNNSCNGSIDVFLAGGTQPYSYDWSGLPDATKLLQNLCENNYQLLVTDSAGCTKIIDYTITDPLQIILGSDGTDVTCFGFCDGTAEVDVTNGISPFTYSWSDNQTTKIANSLCTGTYSITVTDANGCSSNTSYIVGTPTQMNVNIGNFGNISCNGVCDGFAEANASGGTSPYTYNWDIGQTGFTAINLCAGPAPLIATDANGCIATTSITLTQPQALGVSFTKNDVKCFNGLDGQAAAIVAGGTQPYNYAWTPSLQSTAVATGLPAGTYTMNGSDDNGCTISGTVTITQPQELILGVLSTQPTNCGQSNGKACVIATGGTPAFNYSWNDSLTQTQSCATNLLAKSYICTVTDGNGCSKTQTVNINDVAGPNVIITNKTDLTCYNADNGSATALISLGVQPYSYFWSDPAQTSSTFVTNLESNWPSCKDYTITVYDSAGCVTSTTVSICEPEPFLAAIFDSTNATCNLFNDGSATVITQGGQGNFSYFWNSNPPQNTAIATNLLAGNYCVQVTDANNCVASECVNIEDPDPVIVNATAIINSTCFNDDDGSISTQSTGGNPGPKNYSWNPQVGSTPDIFNLAPNTYSITVTDIKGCTGTQNFVITEPAELTATYTVVPSTCGDTNGTACLVPSGGTTPYNYLWNPTSPSQTAICGNNLEAGNYMVKITDKNGCQEDVSITITDIPGPTAVTIVSEKATCNGGQTGKLTATPVGGTLPYTYSWSDGQNLSVASALLAGSYSVTVTDNNNCTITQVAMVLQPNPLVTFLTASDTICYGQCFSLFASSNGGTTPHKYTWSNGYTGGSGPNQVCPTVTTTFTVNTTDTNGCVNAPVSMKLTVLQPLLANIASPAAICQGDTATLTAKATGGMQPYEFQWTPDMGTGTTITYFGKNPGTSGYFKITVSDGCSTPSSDSVQIMVNDTPRVFLTGSDTSGCPPLICNFVALPENFINYSWDFGDGVTATGVSNKPSHTYNTTGFYSVQLTAKSSQGCLGHTSKLNYIEVFPEPVANFALSPTLTTLLSPIISYIDSSAGATSWIWELGDGDTAFVQFPKPHAYKDTGWYKVIQTVENDYGCIDTAVKMIHIEPDYILFAPNAFTPDKDGLNDYFLPVVTGLNEDNFELMIFDRWGLMIYKSTDINKPWDGRALDGSKVAQQDVYVWSLKTMDLNGEKHHYMGHVTLLKKKNE